MVLSFATVLCCDVLCCADVVGVVSVAVTVAVAAVVEWYSSVRCWCFDIAVECAIQSRFSVAHAICETPTLL